jgi:hypothetical protein
MNKAGTLIDIEESMNKLIAQKEALVYSKLQLEAELSSLNTKVRSSQTRLSPNDYESICRRQQNIKNSVLALNQNIVQYKKEIREKDTLMQKIKLQMGGGHPDKVADRIILLRDKYRDFASDATRVSSMRTMASQISQELDVLLKSQ